MQGPDTVKFLEKLLVADLAEIQNGTGSLSVFTNDSGGIVDDTVLTKVSIVCDDLSAICSCSCCLIVGMPAHVSGLWSRISGLPPSLGAAVEVMHFTSSS